MKVKKRWTGDCHNQHGKDECKEEHQNSAKAGANITRRSFKYAKRVIDPVFGCFSHAMGMIRPLT